jgi:hypothetical protein
MIRKPDNLSNSFFNSLTAAQKDLCSIRIKLLAYLDRLNLYEQILGGKSHAVGRFEAEKFRKIRSQPVLDMAIDYARV